MNGDLRGGNGLSGADSATSVVRTYTFHVGDLSDLGVTIAASDTAPEAGTEVTYTVTATNAGPDAASDVTVVLALPPGLTYSSSETTTGSYNSGTWNVGNLAVGSSATLTVTAATGNDTHGKPLTTTARIKATETIGSSVVEELDPQEDNNSAEVIVTPTIQENTNPIFEINRSVPENSAAGVNVGSPISVRDPDEGDTWTFTIEGIGAGNFQVDSAGNVIVAQGANLDYECKANYNLTLSVSDGKDADGNRDTDIDDVLGLDIQLTDVTPTVTVSADHTTLPTGEAVHLTATTTDGPPTCSYSTAYQWHENESIRGGTSLTAIYRHDTAGTRSYYLKLVYEGPDGVYYQYTSDTIQVTWE